jgi:hypothetical protein
MVEVKYGTLAATRPIWFVEFMRHAKAHDVDWAREALADERLVSVDKGVKARVIEVSDSSVAEIRLLDHGQIVYLPEPLLQCSGSPTP